MKKVGKLRLCNWCLLLFTAAILISGIQLEATQSVGRISVWIHIIIGILFFIMVFCHIFLHYGRSNWFSKFHKQKNQVTRILWWVTLATLLTSTIATSHWVISLKHSPIGGLHGKVGFVMILVAACHIGKRKKFFKIPGNKKY